MGTELDKNIGARLRQLRVKSVYTQAQLAELVGCETSTIGHCETGKDRISLTLISKISDVLQIELYKFFIFGEYETREKAPDKIVKLLKKANKTQLGIIYNLIENIIDLV